MATYWIRVLKEAFQRYDAHQSLTQNFSAALLPLAVIIAPWLPGIGQVMPGWTKALPLLAYVLLWAPYRVWVVERERANDAEARLVPSFALAVAEHAIEYRRFARLKVTNSAAAQIVDCTGRLLDLERCADGVCEPHPYHIAGFLQWSPGDGGINLHTFPTRAYLDVATITHAYRGDIRLMLFDQPPIYVQETHRWRFTIEVAALNAPTVSGRFELWVEPLGRHDQPDGDGGFSPIDLPALRLRAIE